MAPSGWGLGLGDTSLCPPQHPKPPGKGIFCLSQSSTGEGIGESSERLRGCSARFMARVGSRESRAEVLRVGVEEKAGEKVG